MITNEQDIVYLTGVDYDITLQMAATVAPTCLWENCDQHIVDRWRRFASLHYNCARRM